MTDKKSKIRIILFILIVVLSLSRIIYLFVTEKSGLHSDEIWSYGLANSYYEPYIYTDADETELHNLNEWISGETFKNYITVQDDQRFNYPSVNYNMSKDMHPPLFFFILHTICSFFPNTYSLWYGFVINVVLFVIIMIYIFRLSKLLTNNDYFALAFTAYFGFCDGVLNLFEFIRMYALSTTIFTALMFYMLRLIKSGNIKKNVPFIAITIFLGAYTHHFFVIAAGAFALFASLYFLFRKKFKILFINGFSMLGAVGLSVLVFPATIPHLFSDAGDIYQRKMPSYFFSVKTCLRCCLFELFGIPISRVRSMLTSYIIAAVILLLAIFIPILFLFRRSEWVKKNIFMLPKRVWRYLKRHNKTSLVFCLICLLTSITVIFVVAKTVNTFAMEDHTDRYLFIIFPALALAVCYIIYEFLLIIIKKHKWIPKTIFALILSLFVVVATTLNGCIYFFNQKTEDTVEMEKVVADSNVILVVSREWTITCYPQYLMNCEKVYATSYLVCDKVPERVKSNIGKLDNDKPVYLVFIATCLYDDYEAPSEVTVDNLGYAAYGVDRQKMLDLFKEFPVTEKFEFVGDDNVFGEQVIIYKIRD